MTFLHCALLLSLAFFLLSYLTVLSLTASASLPHAGISFLVSFLAISVLVWFFFFPLPSHLLDIVFFFLIMFCAVSLSIATLISICPTGALFIGFIWSLMYFSYHFLPSPYLFIPNTTYEITEGWQKVHNLPHCWVRCLHRIQPEAVTETGSKPGATLIHVSGPHNWPSAMWAHLLFCLAKGIS